MKVTTATLKIEAITPYSQSRRHESSKLKGELADDYNKRTWKSFCTLDKNNIVVIPADGFHQALMSGARYSKKQIPGQGKATWTAKFTAGIAVPANISTGVHIDNVTSIDINANSDGVRGSGSRVYRRYPMINDWSASFDVVILDPIITESIFCEIVELTGMFIGIGRYRPEKGGSNGRFRLEDCTWNENRDFETAFKQRGK